MVAVVTGASLGVERTSGFVLGSRGQLGSSTFGRFGENVTVNAATGNLFINRTDEILIGKGPDSVIGRSYNSLGLGTDDNGDNWQLNAQRRIAGLTGTVSSAGSTVTRYDWDGSSSVYTWDAGVSAYVGEDGGGSYDRITYASNIWTWTDGDSRVVETYDHANNGRITASKDSDGNSLTYAYTDTRLTRVTTASGEYTDISWSGYNITQITTGLTGGATLSRTRYTYDTSNRLSTVTTDLTPDDESVTDNQKVVTTYTYSGTSDRIASISQTGGALLTIGYTLYGSDYRVTSYTQTNASGVTNVTTLSYDTTNRVTTITDGLGQITKLTYDTALQLKKIELPPAQSGASAQIIQYGYNANGDVTSQTDAVGNITTYSYDSRGNLLTQLDADGTQTSYTYNAANQLVILNLAGAVTRYSYDSEQHLRFAISAEGHVTEYRYNATGQQTSVLTFPQESYDVDALAATATLSETTMAAWVTGLGDLSGIRRSDTAYDFRGNISTVKGYTSANSSGAGTGWIKTVTYTYDQYGSLLTRQTSGASTETFVYDGLGRVLSAIDLNGGTTSSVFTDGSNQQVVTLANGLVQTSVYNLAGDLISYQTSGSGLTTAKVIYSYDDLGQLRSVTYADNPGDSTPAAVKSYYIYDAVGRKIADIAADGAISEYRYDKSDNVVATIRYAITSTAVDSLVDTNGRPADVTLASLRSAIPSDAQWEWRIFDSQNGHLLEVIDAAGAVTAFTYDALSNLVATTSYYNKFGSGTLSSFKSTIPTVVTLPTANAAKDNVARNFYDDDGRLIGTLDALGYLKRFNYDSAGAQVSTVAYANFVPINLRATGSFSEVVTGAGSNSRDIKSYAVYDTSGRLQYALDANLRPTQYYYDGGGRVFQTIEFGASIAANGDYTAAYISSQITSLNLTNHAATRRSWTIYDAVGRLAYSIDPNGGVTSYAYNNRGEIVRSIQYSTTRSTTSLPDLATMNSWASANSGTDDRVSRYFYNARGEQRFAIDPEGFVTRKDFDLEGRLTATYRFDTAYAATDATTYAIINGTSLGSNTGEIITYDALGRISTTSNGVGVITQFIYDALDRIIDRTTAYGTSEAVTTHYSYDAVGQVASETAAYGTTDAATISYTYDGLGNVLTRKDARNYTTTYTYDGLGQLLTTTVPIDSATNAVTTFTYDGFGNRISTTDARGYASYSTYDLLNRLIWQVDAESHVTKTVYGMGSEIASVTRYAAKATASGPAVVPTVTANSSEDATTSFTRDKLGRVTKVTDAMGKFEQYTLDAFGNRVAILNKLGGTVTNIFDRRGLLTSETLPVGSTRADGTVQSATITNTYSYDARGNKRYVTEAAGLTEERTTEYTYSRLDRITGIVNNATPTASSGSRDATGSFQKIETFAYDLHGNLIESKVRHKNVTTSAYTNINRTLFYYDDLDRKVGELKSTTSFSAGTLSTWSFDANGNALSAKVYDVDVTLPATAGGPLSGLTLPSVYRETTFGYDRASRLVTSTVAGLLVGRVGSDGVYTAVTSNVSTTIYYDTMGNIIRQRDGNLDNIYYFYDKLGRKVAQADQENYYTTYALDADGNVTSERRYATILSATPTAGTLPTAPSTSGADRVTNFTYDRNGRRLTESRTGVAYSSISATGAKTDYTNGTATITYAYNALGQVTRKTEATNDFVEYVYDTMGRQTSMLSSAFTDFNENSVKRLTENSYDGLNNLATTTERGVLASDGATTSGDTARITRYYYNEMGLLNRLKDSAGFSHYYAYDGAGRLIRDYYERANSAGTSVGWEATAYRYDAADRVIGQGVSLWNGTAWTTPIAETQILYNAYGETARRGINGTSQESFGYDAGGRLWRSTASDGTIKIFYNDALGNQTLMVTSTGGALPTGPGQMLNLLNANGTAQIGTVAMTGMVATITIYDKRGKAEETREAMRETTAIGSSYGQLTTKRTYNAFGEVTQEIDARNNVTDFSYNTLGKVTKRQSPTVSWTAENGAQANARPTENYFYDLSGRLVGVQDANGNVNTLALLSGTGYGGDEALAINEFHADSGIITKQYDVFNDLRISKSETGKKQYYYYDGRGLLNQQAQEERADATRLRDYYGYDILGQRIWHYNNQYGSSVKDTTDYDSMGRVISALDMGGNSTTYSYVWSSALATTGLGTFGGWTKTTVNAAGRSMTEATDYFGRVIDKVDFGGHDYAFSYDLGGRLTGRTSNSGETISYSYFNTGLMAQMVSGYSTDYYGSTATSTFRYDVDGNRTFEGHVVSGTYYDWYYGTSSTYSTTHQQATVTWDAMNRMTGYTDAGTSSSPVDIDWEYDLSGNIRHMKSVFRYMDAQGVISSTDATQDYWYKYDSMNRFVTTKGTFTGARGSGTISKGSAGTDVTYDLSGQRATAVTQAKLSRILWQRNVSGGATTYWDEQDPEPMPGVTWTRKTWEYWGDRKDTYSYSADGYLDSVAFAQQGLATNGTSTLTVTALGGATTRARYVRDAMGRVTDYSEYTGTGYDSTNASTNRVYQRLATYNSKSQVTSDVVTSVRSDGTWVNNSTYYYNATETSSGSGEWQGVATGGSYMGGAVTRIATSITKDGAAQTGNTTTYSYKWWGGALQSKTNYVSGSTNNVSSFYYDESGNLTSVYIQDGRPRTVSFINDASGQVLQRDEADNNSTTGDPRELHFYFNGLRVGDISNNGTSDVDYATSIAQHTTAGGLGAFRNGATTSTPFADFDQSYDPINGLNYEGAATRYTVQAGDTLETIAQNLWGDASFWYLIADVNGLNGSETLDPGMSLIIPNKVHNSHNNSDTYKVYDPNEAIGDTMPTAAKPPKKAKCGTFGQVLMVAIAVAVTMIALPGAGATIGQGILAGLAGSGASQAFGLATGIQQKFDFKGLALAGIAGGAAAGLGVNGAFSKAGKGVSLSSALGIGNATIGAAVQGTVGNLVSQGIGMATGLQGKFNWAGVATAGIGAGVGNALGGNGTWGRAASGMAGGIAAAAGESLITGNSFGDTLMSSLPSIIGNTIGNMAGDAIAGNGRGGTSGSGKQNNPDVASGNDSTTGGNSAAQIAKIGASQAQAANQSNNSTEGQIADIIVTADRQMRYMFGAMSDYQFGRYYGQYGQSNNHDGAQWALRQQAPNVISSLISNSSGSRYSASLTDYFNAGGGRSGPRPTGFLNGVGAGIRGAVTGMYNTVRHPIETAGGIARMIDTAVMSNPSDVAYGATRLYNRATHATAYDVGNFAGGAIVGAASGFTLSRVSALGRISSAVDGVGGVAAARARQWTMLQDDVGFNISPTVWDQYPTIGRTGTFVTDRAGAMGYFGDVSGLSEMTVSSRLASGIEMDMGLVPGTLQDGFKVRQITGLQINDPYSPMFGNPYFTGAGNHLPGGAPEMVINSIPTIDNGMVTTILNVKVRR